jgi:hypothetical protein
MKLGRILQTFSRHILPPSSGSKICQQEEESKLFQIQGFPSNATLFQQLFTILFKFSATCFHQKMVVRPKHIADNVNKIVNNYWNRVALDGNP